MNSNSILRFEFKMKRIKILTKIFIKKKNCFFPFFVIIFKICAAKPLQKANGFLKTKPTDVEIKSQQKNVDHQKNFLDFFFSLFSYTQNCHRHILLILVFYFFIITSMTILILTLIVIMVIIDIANVIVNC